MKILEIIFSLTSGGAERFVVDLSNQMVLNGNDITLCTLKDDSGLGSFYKSDVSSKIQYDNLNFGVFKLSYLWKIYSYVKKCKPDVVHMHLSNITMFCSLAILFYRKPLYVVTCHTQAELEKAGNKFGFWSKFLMYKLNLFHLIAISHENEKSIFSVYKKNASSLIYNGRAFTNTTFALKTVEAEIHSLKKSYSTVVYINVARCHPLKNHERLIDAFNQLLSHGYDAILLILGGGFDSDFGAKLMQKASGNVFFLGPKHNVVDYLVCSDVFCLSSDYEGMPITLIEAMASGCVPVGTPVSGIIDVIKEGQNGFVSKDFSIEELASAFERAMKGYKNISADNMKKMYIDNFSIDICADKYQFFFKKYLSTKK